MLEFDDCVEYDDIANHFPNCHYKGCVCKDYLSGTVFEPPIYGNQAGIVPVNASQMMKGPSCEAEETLCFENDDTSPIYSVMTSTDATRNLVSYKDATLGAFLKRPVLISTQIWSTSGGFTLATIDPWTLFYTNAAVAQKIKNFYLLRSNLHVKILISGGPFYFGRLLVDYTPLSSSSNIENNRNLQPLDAIAASQRPHLYIDPCTSSAGAMVLPFLYPADYITALTANADWAKMGTLTIRALSALKHANGAVSDLSVSFYAWAEDVELLIPTSQSELIYENQSAEYGKGILSKPLTAAANVAGRMGEIISFRPYARATQMVLTGLSQWASLLGFSRPQILDDLHPVRAFHTGHMAVADRPEMIQKLTLDSKQELSIDPRIVGLGGADEMSFTSIATRESYLTKFTWTVANPTNTLLFTCPVSPILMDTSGVELHMTPMCFLSEAFQFWRGTINFRFIIVASAQHKGKLRISFDPLQQTVSPVNVNYNRVIDIATTKDFTIPFSWCQDTAFKLTDTTYSARHSTTPIGANEAFWNGIMSVYVANELGVPNSVVNNDIELIVCVSAGDDFELASPWSTQVNTLSVFTNQAGVIDPSATAQGDDCMPIGTNVLSPIGESVAIGSLYDVFFGEKVSSLRYLFKRYNTFNTFYPPLAARANATHYDWTVFFPSFPLPYGYDPSGFYTTTGPLAKKFNTNTQTFMAYFAPAYLMRRGGNRWKAIANGAGDNYRSNLVIKRQTLKLVVGTNRMSNLALASPPPLTSVDASMSVYANAALNFGGEGVAADICDMGIEVESPFYSNTRFRRCRAFDAIAVDVQNLINIHLPYFYSTTAQVPSINTYCGAAEDLTYHFFLSVPVMYNYTLSTII